MGEVIAAMDRPPDAPLNRRPWPADTYDRSADTFHIGGWYDIFTQGTLDQYAGDGRGRARSHRRPPRLLVGPWTHSVFVEPPRGARLRAGRLRRRPRRDAAV